jgi:hypothetical protein
LPFFLIILIGSEAKHSLEREGTGSLLPGEFLDQPNDFTGFGVAAGVKLGKDQPVIYADLVTATARGHKRDTFNLRLEIYEQILHQAHGPVGIVSNRAINDLDLHHKCASWLNDAKIILLLG